MCVQFGVRLILNAIERSLFVRSEFFLMLIAPHVCLLLLPHIIRTLAPRHVRATERAASLHVDSPWTNQLNEKLVYMQEQGILARLKTKWWTSEGEQCDVCTGCATDGVPLTGLDDSERDKIPHWLSRQW